MNIEVFSDIIGRIYDAAIGVGRWESALELIARSFESGQAQIVFAARDQKTPSFAWRCLRLGAPDLTPPAGRIASTATKSSMTPSNEDRSRSAVFDVSRTGEVDEDVIAPTTDNEHAMFFPIPWAETATCCLALTRSPHQPRYTEADYKAVARFVPHLSQALTLCGLRHRSHKRASAAHALIDGLPLGMMVVSNGEVTLANETARSLLGDGDPLRDRKGRVRRSMGLVDTALRNLPALSQTNGEPVGIILPGGKGRPLFAIIRRINPTIADPRSTCGDFSVVYLTEPRRRIEISEDILGQLFGVTGREASVLSALVRGDDVQAIGRRLAIRPETVRVHLKALMRKTGTAGQADLVRLVLSSSARIAGASVAPDATTPARRNEIVHAVSR